MSVRAAILGHVPPAAKPPLSDFWRDLPREGKLLLSVVAFQFIGTGLVLPFWVVYLHEVRGFSLDTTGLLLGVLALAGVVVSLPGGHAIDRFGPRRTLLFALACSMTGQTIMAFATTVPVALIGLCLVGTSFGLSWPASQSFVASVVPSAVRQRYFGMNFALLNLGIGIGGIIGGLVADVQRPVTFEVMYLVEAASYSPAVILLLVPLRHVGGSAAVPVTEGPATRVTYLQVLRMPAVASLTTLSFVASFVGYAQFNAGMPAYARAIGEVSTRGLGWAFAANTLVIVLLQLVVLQRIEGRRRTRVIVVMCLIWALSWVLLAGSGLAPGTWAATLMVTGCASVFALGETLLQPTIPAMVNDMAPDHLRGRYNAVTSSGFQLAAVTGPPVAGFLIGHHFGGLYIGLLLLGLVLLGAMALGRIEHQLTPRANGLLDTPQLPDPTGATPPVTGPVGPAG